VRIGIDLGGTKIEGIALDGSREIARLRVATPRDDYRATLDAIRHVVSTLEAGASMSASLGIGIPGALDPDTGLVKNANSTWLIGRPLQTDLEALLGRPVRIANDANCFAASEASDGAAAGARVVFGVIAGTGVGAGIIVDGQPLTGRHAIAGEWGHNPLPWPKEDEWPGPTCYCGRTGCVETFLSGPGMSRDHERQTGVHVAPPEIALRAAVGEAAADATLARYEHRMARALAAIINVLDPDVIVLGGGMSNIDRLYVNVPRIWGAFVFGATRTGGDSRRHDAIVRTRLVRAVHGDSSGVRGAARLWNIHGAVAGNTGGETT
jgi:fructokinase